MLLHLLTRWGRRRIIFDRDNQAPYLYRYYLLFKDKTQDHETANRVPFNLMLHKICASDPDDLHDHPWWYATFILKGGYWEVTPAGRFWRGPGHFRLRRARALHRLELPENSEGSWSLFLRGTKVRDWGFIRQGQWVYHRHYLRDRAIAASGNPNP